MTDWSSWGRRRPPATLLHLDNAAASRPSRATLEASAAHSWLEAEIGAYVAQEQARDVLDQLRADVANLFGVPTDGVAFVESASNALRALISCWPLRPGDRIVVAPAEWGPNIEVFEHHGLPVETLAVDPAGRIDLDALQRRLDIDPPAVVNLTQVTSHRGLVQPVRDAAVVCRAAGVPLWVDAAQALGHVDAACDADAIYSTSRKWLAGPRGVGMLGVAERNWDRLDILRLRLDGSGLPPVRYLESHDAHVAGRIGLATAVREYLADGVAAVETRLTELGQLTRTLLAEVPGWGLAGPADAQGAITGIRPLAGQDVASTRSRLLAEHGILTTAGGVARAPRDMPEPLLRVSPHVDCTPEDLQRLAAALTCLT